ncbi:MAG TPA: YifB family Mg chelatase-like AAA ATPase [Mycobacteriales bacterium]|nr:YifB family Mg chelatase-like AAA ATPase [Mycobacteriales bacterium]
MALARAFSVALVGLEAHVVEVEADLGQGLPGLTLVGLPDAAVAESRDRVRAAVQNSGLQWPLRRITLGLSPASLPKRGSAFDLAIAAAIVAAGDEELPAAALTDLVLLGELALDGGIRPVRGVLPAVRGARDAGFRRVVVPAGNLAEARLVDGVESYGLRRLTDLVRLVRHGEYDEPEQDVRPSGGSDQPALDLVDVAGQPLGRSAVEVAAAGGHHLFLLGPPGSGKTMLAERLPGLLPPLSREEALEVTSVHSVAGALPRASPLVEHPPFQDPHHGATVTSIVGGGSGIARPGAASLAHRGVLFLDEAPEFPRGVLDALRQPLERGSLSIRRVGGTATYPARFTLVLAANPCPCAVDGEGCTCSPRARRAYLARLSGPLMDRIDLQVTLPRVTRAEVLAEGGRGEPSADVAARVAQARQRALHRYAGTPWRANADVPPVELRRRWPLPRSVTLHADEALDSGALTARGYDRVLRIAWTLADLAQVSAPGEEQVGQALLLRGVTPRPAWSAA